MAKHAKFSPSAMVRVRGCPGSVAMCEADKRTTSDYAEFGTATHDLSQRIIDRHKDADRETIESLFLGAKMENGWEVTADMIDLAMAYRDAALALAPYEILDTEVRVDLTDECWGTADLIGVCGTHLYVQDLKTGQGNKIYAENNPQLMTYAAAALELYGAIQEITDVTMVIHQQAISGHTDTWTVDAKTIEKWGADLKEYLDAIGPDSPRTPGEKQCQWCSAKARCPELKEFVNETLSSEFAVKVTTPTEPVDGADLAERLAHIPLLEVYISAVQARAYSALNDGEEIPGFKLVSGRRGARRWDNADAAEEALKAMRFKQDEMYKKTLATPKQITDLCKGSPRKLKKVEALIVQPEGKPVIAPESDKRPAITRTVDQFDTTDDAGDML